MQKQQYHISNDEWTLAVTRITRWMPQLWSHPHREFPPFFAALKEKFKANEKKS